MRLERLNYARRDLENLIWTWEGTYMRSPELKKTSATLGNKIENVRQEIDFYIFLIYLPTVFL